MEKKLTELIDKALTRRSFMTRSGAAAAVAVVAGCSGGNATPAPTPTPTPTPTPVVVLGDTDYLNFALNLEYLEAEFYLRAATGSGLTGADTGSANTEVIVPSTTLVPNLTAVQQAYIYEIAQNELDHVRFLRSALGSAAVPRPQIDLMNSFNAAATAAGIGSSFNPFSSYQAFLVGAFVFEDVGVTAYEGAAALLSSKTLLSAAVAIHNVEAYHAGEIRTLLIADSVANATTAGTTVSPNNTYVTYAQQISTLRAALGGGKETTLTPLPPYQNPFVSTAYTPASTIVACDSTNSICFARTTDQVLHIVYAAAPGAGVKGGGFFPNGMNGNISVTTS
jgi:Ferritin-like domain